MNGHKPILSVFSAFFFVLLSSVSTIVFSHDGHDEVLESANHDVSSDSVSEVDINAESTPFDAEDTTAPIIVRPENLRQLEKSGLLLTAIFYVKEAGVSLAVIEDKSRTWGVYQAGDEINDQTVLVDIKDDHVIIDKASEGRLELGFSYEMTGVEIQKL